MRKMCKIFLLMLALSVALCAAAFADTEGFTFALNGAGDGYVVTGYTGSASSVKVPDWYNQKPVTEIGDSAFEGNKTITYVEMPNTIAVIGEAAFKNCTKLAAVNYYPAASEPPASDRIPGDLNDNGEADIQDALLIMQYSAGWNVSIDKTTADVDGVEGVTLDDALLILRYGAGEDVTLQ